MDPETHSPTTGEMTEETTGATIVVMAVGTPGGTITVGETTGGVTTIEETTGVTTGGMTGVTETDTTASGDGRLPEGRTGGRLNDGSRLSRHYLASCGVAEWTVDPQQQSQCYMNRRGITLLPLNIH